MKKFIKFAIFAVVPTILLLALAIVREKLGERYVAGMNLDYCNFEMELTLGLPVIAGLTYLTFLQLCTYL